MAKNSDVPGVRNEKKSANEMGVMETVDSGRLVKSPKRNVRISMRIVKISGRRSIGFYKTAISQLQTDIVFRLNPSIFYSFFIRNYT